MQPYGFDIQNSPCQILKSWSAPSEADHPAVDLGHAPDRRGGPSRRDLRLLPSQRGGAGQHLAEQDRDVLLLGADSRGEFREEDQLCTARFRERWSQPAGEVADRTLTEEVLARCGRGSRRRHSWRGRSARYLRDTGQQDDLAFVLGAHRRPRDRVRRRAGRGPHGTGRLIGAAKLSGAGARRRRASRVATGLSRAAGRGAGG